MVFNGELTKQRTLRKKLMANYMVIICLIANVRLKYKNKTKMTRNLRESFFFYLCDLINKIDIIGHSPTWSAAPIPNKSTRSIVMATKIDKLKLAQTINDLPELDSETKSQLLQLIHERKQYGLVWEEHHEEVEQQMQTQLPVLVEDKSKFIDSADPNAPNHILIEGDNLLALTTLTYTHKEKIDVIYIDPPYNTGNKDFIYNDHIVGTDDDYRHSKWLSFMSKRLRIAKTLLSDKGVIFISIDDNEQAQLKMLCDEIFGAGNFVACYLWNKTSTPPALSKKVRRTHEYIVCYTKQNDSQQKFVGLVNDGGDAPLLNEGNKEIVLSFPANYVFTSLPNGIYKAGRKERVELLNDVEVQGGIIKSAFQLRGHFRWTQDTLNNEIGKQCKLIVKSDKFAIRYCRQDERTVAPPNFITQRFYADTTIDREMGVDTNERAGEELVAILGSKVFDFPKPMSLVKYIIRFLDNKSATILDFFAGSGTTLHATMQLNAEDGGHRQCILITNNENNICEEVTYERNKRVIQGYTTPKGESVAGLTANKLRYYRTDFVARESSLTAKKQLMLAATDLLCIKESIYTECHTFGNLRLRSSVVRYFADADAQMLIIYNPDAIDTIVAEISRMDIISPIRIYVFSANDYAYNADFEAVDNKVLLCALPAAIYNAYRKVLSKKQQPQDEPATADTELTVEEDTL